VVTAAELLAEAAFREDRYAQAFPSFGSERMDAPVMSFCRAFDFVAGPSAPPGLEGSRRRGADG